MLRIGFGYDAHQFTEGDSLTLAAVKVPFDKGILAHSDGDVVLHALCDALLGAAALGDIGQYFPNTAEHKNKQSSEFVTTVLNMLNKKNYSVSNVDVTIVLEKPKLAEYIMAMRKNIADLLAMDLCYISVKATTNDRLGWIGKGEGLAAHVVVLIS